MATTTQTKSTFTPTEFRPRRFMQNGHIQTILGNYLPRPNHLPEPEAHLVEVSRATETQIGRAHV